MNRRWRPRARLAVVLLAACLVARSVGAQPLLPRPRFELTLGGEWLGRVALDTKDARETRPAGSTLSLFSTDAVIEPSYSFGARIAVRLTKSIDLEGGVSIASRDLVVRVSGDFEDAGAFAIAETMRQLLVEGGLVVYLGRPPAAATRVRPFISMGGGRFWDIHEGGTLAASGEQIFVGGGVKYLLKARTRRRGAWKGIGLRGDVRLVARRGGGVFDDDVRVVPAAGAAVFFPF